MAKPKILVVDDEQSIRNLVTAYLPKEEFEIFMAADGKAGLQAAREHQPEIVILDVMLPEMNGIEVLTRLRRESDAYVILLTAKTDETDKIIGLSVGADDYVTKPFSPRELAARVKAALRRLKGAADASDTKVLAFEHLKIDPERRQVWIDGREIELTQTEFELLFALAQHRGLVLSRDQLLEQVWGGAYFGELRVVDVHLGHVRQKLGRDDLIATVRGVGYRFEDKRA